MKATKNDKKIESMFRTPKNATREFESIDDGYIVKVEPGPQGEYMARSFARKDVDGVDTKAETHRAIASDPWDAAVLLAVLMGTEQRLPKSLVKLLTAEEE